MTWLLRIFGSSLARYGAVALIVAAFSLVGVPLIKSTLYKANQYDVLQAEKAALVEQMAEQAKQAEERVAQLEADREEIKRHHVEFERRAVRENSKLKQALRDNEDAKNWANTAIPDSIKRLREPAKTR